MPRSAGHVCLLVIICVSAVGCLFGSRAPAKPDLSPAESADLAIQQYGGGDATITEEEAAAAPGLLAAFQKIDKDGNGELTKEEIEERIVYYTTSTSWVIPGTCLVTYRGQPLGGATVTFEPESFLGPSFQPCVGETDERGQANLSRADSEIDGIYLGFYRVRITKAKKNGEELLNARYNTETTLGFEANNDVPDAANYGGIKFNLK